MSGRAPGFEGLTVATVQDEFFLGRFVRGGGRFRYCTSGLRADRGSVVLFQFKARVVASAVLLGDEPFDRPTGGYAGALHFDAASVRTFGPWDAAMMREVWPAFRSFGHAKFGLNPGQYPEFVRRLTGVRRPTR